MSLTCQKLRLSHNAAPGLDCIISMFRKFLVFKFDNIVKACSFGTICVKECRNAVKKAVIFVECGNKFDSNKTCGPAGFPAKGRWNVRNVVCSYVCCCLGLS